MRKLTLLAAALSTAALSSCGTTQSPLPQQGSAATMKAAAPTEAPADARSMTAQFTPAGGLQSQIVYGTVSARGAHPHQVYLSIQTSQGNYMCGGSIISNGWVLTAAHCLDGVSASGVTVRAGANKLSSTQGQNIKAAALYLHPNYVSAERGSDIALIKLSSPVTYGTYVQPIKLPNNAVESALDVAGKTATVTGWGVTENGSTSDDLREVVLPITPNPTRCGNGSAPGDTICGEYSSGKDSCNGDSGGPLGNSYGGNRYVLGIVSYGPQECRGYGIYTRVNAYLDWIARVSGVTADSTSPTEPAPAPAPGTTTYTGTLSSGQTLYAPNTTGFAYAGGTLTGKLSGPSGTDFDLYLQKQGSAGWSNVASSLGDSSTESVSYSAGSGTYRWAVKSYAGSGTATLVETK